MATYFSTEHDNARQGWCYDALKSGRVRFGEQTISLELVEVERNTPEGWKRAAGTGADVDCLFYEVWLEPEEDPETDIKNLQYFFIRADRELRRRQGSAGQLGLLVHLTGKKLYKLKTYLAMVAQRGTRYNLLYAVDTREGKKCYPIAPEELKQSSSVKLGKMLPLIHVVAEREPDGPGEVYLADLLGSQVRAGGRQIKLENGEIEACLQKDFDEISRNWWESLLGCCRSMLGRTAKQLLGTRKERVRESLGRFICDRRGDMTLMAELHWFFHLQKLAELQQLADRSGRLREDVLEKSRKDAIVCAEGISQILENSCQHAGQRAAYLSLRLHEVSLEESTRNMVTTVANRQRIIERYQNMWKRGAVPRDGKTWRSEEVLHRAAKYYFEITVVDDAAEEGEAGRVCGIVDRYVRNAQAVAGPEARLPRLLKDVFADECCIDRTHTVMHYGLQALCRHVQVNHGCFLVSSPRDRVYEKWDTGTRGEEPQQTGTEIVLFRSDKKLMQRTMQEKLETTEYHILLPVGLPEPESERAEEAAKKIKIDDEPAVENLLDLDCLRSSQKNPIKVCREKIGMPEDTGLPEKFPDQKYKDQGVERYARKLHGIIERVRKPENTIFLLDIRELDDIHTEIFSKALFLHIMDSRSPRGLFALFFRGSIQQQITIRLCAVFYSRCRRLSLSTALVREKPNVQVALCSRNPRNYPEVNMILNFKDWNSLGETVIRYAYNNLAASHKLYAQIKYFLDRPGIDWRSKKNHPAMEVFPFDLYLKETMDDTEGAGDKEKMCWFLQSVDSMLSRELQRENNGIMVRDIHVHLPTNVHVEAFYAADLLFRNVSFVCRFAYLLALRLRKAAFYQENDDVLIVCYEAYSSLLMQYLEFYLNESAGQPGHVRSAIVYREKGQDAMLHLPADLEEAQQRDPNFFGKWKYVVLCPIATTLSTVHMIHELIGRNCSPVTPENMKDYAIILVGQSRVEREKDEIQSRYWSVPEHTRDAGFVRLRDRSSKEQSWDVGYLVRVSISWHGPDACGDDAKKTLVHADTTSTELKLLFPRKLTREQTALLMNEHGVLRPDLMDPDHWGMLHQHDVCSMISPSGTNAEAHGDRLRENNRRLGLLRGCIRYSHIVKSSNHYAYYLEFPQCYKKIKSPENIRDWKRWLMSLRRAQRTDMLTILVAPLRSGISPFLKDLIDYVFTDSIHVLQLDIHNTSRLDMMTKYRSVAEACREALDADPGLELQVHYIDDSIVTADSLRRAQSMVDMLLRSHISTECMERRVRLFSGVYVMINRSSRDTIQSLVSDPDRDFHAYMHLAVPHFNTHNDYCPSCAQVEKFKLLNKCSSTNRFAGEFQRLAEKHIKRTPEEYVQWQIQQLHSSRSAFLRLRQWVSNQKGNPPPELEADYKLVCENLQKVQAQAYQRIYQKYMALVERENRDIRRRNLQILEDALNAHADGLCTVTLKPLRPGFGNVSELLFALTSVDVYREAIKKCNAYRGTQLYRRGRKSLSYTAEVEPVKNAEKEYERLRQEFLKELGELKLEDCLKRTEGAPAAYARTKKAYERLWIDGVLADQAYRRMMSVHEAFSGLILEKETKTVEQMRNAVLDYLLREREMAADELRDAPPALRKIRRWEWLHSALKVLSRYELVHYHMVRAAMFQILMECAQAMLGMDPDADDQIIGAAELLQLEPDGRIMRLLCEPDESIDMLMRYQLFSGIMRRLADMQSNYPIETLGRDEILPQLQKLTGHFFEDGAAPGRMKPLEDRWFYHTIPSFEKMVFSYEKYMKLSTMAEDDETKSDKIQMQFIRNGVYS